MSFTAFEMSVMVTPAAMQFRGIRHDVEFRNFAALHQDGTDARAAVQRRLQFVRSDFP